MKGIFKDINNENKIFNGEITFRQNLIKLREGNF